MPVLKYQSNLLLSGIHFYRSYTLLIIVVHGAITQEGYSITKIDHSPGIFYEPMGKVRFTEEYWKLVVYVDIGGEVEKDRQIRDLYQKLVLLCSQIKKIQEENIPSSPCDLTLNSLAPKLLSTEKAMYELGSLVNRPYNPTKVVKRGTIDFLGRVMKLLVGTLDDEDAAYYNKHIDLFKKNEMTLQLSMREQTHVIKSTMSHFNHTTTVISKNQELLSKAIDSLQNEVQTQAKWIHTAIKRVIMSEQIELLDINLNELHAELSTLIDAILLARVGQLHPSILGPRELLSQLQKIHSMSKLNLPIDLEHDPFENMFKVISVGAYAQKDKIVLVVKVPLAANDEYSVFKVNPLPTKVNDHNFVYVKPRMEYVGFDETKQLYIIMNLFEYEKCSSLGDSKSLCPRKPIPHPTYLTQECEIMLFVSFHVRVPDSCEKRIVNVQQSIWQPMVMLSKWIVIPVTAEKVTIICNGVTTPEIFSSPSIVHLGPGCKMYASDITLVGTKETAVELSDRYYFPQINLGEDCCVSKSGWNINLTTVPIATKYKRADLHLDDLNMASIKLDEIDQNLNSLNWIAATSPTYWTTTFVIIAVIVLTCYCCCQGCFPQIFFRRRCCPNLCITMASHNSSENTVHYRPEHEIDEQGRGTSRTSPTRTPVGRPSIGMRMTPHRD